MFLPVPFAVKELMLILVLFNVAIGVLNLVPAHPLDGHKLAVGMLWCAISSGKARKIIRRIGLGWAAVEGLLQRSCSFRDRSSVWQLSSSRPPSASSLRSASCVSRLPIAPSPSSLRAGSNGDARTAQANARTADKQREEGPQPRRVCEDMRRHRLRRADGQVLILVALAMPLMIALLGLAADGGTLMVQRRSIQNAADAAALAAAQNVRKPSCDATCVGDNAAHYSDLNGGPTTLHQCANASDTNCYAWPYKGKDGLVEVRLKKAVPAVFTRMLGLSSLFDVSARAVGSADPITTVTDPTVSTSTKMNDGGVPAVAFAKSTACAGDSNLPSAIKLSGSGAHYTAFVANGGITVGGNSTLTVDALALGRKGDTAHGCDDYGSVSSDITGPWSPPRDWPVPLPTVPTLGVGCAPTGAATIGSTWPGPTHPPGIYCATGTLSFSGVDLSAGYTFYAPSIKVSSNGNKFKYYPPASGQRPVVFDAYSGDISMTGQNQSVQGDLYAPNGTISISGGAGASFGGFMEAQNLDISGNDSNYVGSGPMVGGTTTTTTTTTPGTTSTVGTTIGLSE